MSNQKWEQDWHREKSDQLLKSNWMEMWSLILKIYLASWPGSPNTFQTGYFYVTWAESKCIGS